MSSTSNVAIWQPVLPSEISAAKHAAGLYGAGVLEIHDTDQLRAVLARLDATLVRLEIAKDSVPLDWYEHPERGLYLIGPVNGTLPAEVLDLPGATVQVETDSIFPLRPDVAAAITLHHRHIQRQVARL